MADNFDYKRCDSKTLPEDTAISAYRLGTATGHPLIEPMRKELFDVSDKCSLTWAKNIAKDFQKQQQAEDSHYDNNSWIVKDHQRFYTKEVLDDRAALMRSTAQTEILELSIQHLETILKKHEKAG